MEVMLDNKIIKVNIIRKRVKNVTFRFKNNELYISCNSLVPEFEIKRMIASNEKSLTKLYNKQAARDDVDRVFTYLGEPYTIVYDESVKNTYIDDDMIYTKNEQKFNKWYLEECSRIFSERMKLQLNNFTDIPKFSLRIRKMTTRWGVNNVTKKIITLNSELLKKDVTLIDYVIVHELCHFYEANHSDRFWYQVSLRYPYYKLARKRLRSE